MPFTFSHPAAAVPFVRFRLPLSALVVGSMVPDFVYFMPTTMDAKFGHTWPGLFVFCIPMGLCVLWLFHRIFKLPMLSILPVSHQERIVSIDSSFHFGPAAQFVRILIALLVGALTHIFWDSFTHVGSHGVQFSPISWLLQHAVMPPRLTVTLLQYISTLLGAALLMRWYWQWFVGAAACPEALPVQIIPPHWRRSLLLVPIVITNLAVSSWLLLNVLHIRPQWKLNFFVYVLISAIKLTLVQLLIYTLAWQWKAAKLRFFTA